jgi:hypothetical protein
LWKKNKKISQSKLSIKLKRKESNIRQANFSV